VQSAYNVRIPNSSPDLTGLLLAWGQGDAAALDRLMPFVHDELHRIARRHMNRERGNQSLQATALVNEAYLRLADAHRLQLSDRRHFFALAAKVMRQILVDGARARGCAKRGGMAARVTFDEGLIVSDEPGPTLIALDDALRALADFDPRKGQVVELKFFGGLSVDEIALQLRISPETVMRDWKFAKAWLLREMGGGAA
jgi:RNA polymerase sigma factor (TIGR02999 family)